MKYAIAIFVVVLAFGLNSASAGLAVVEDNFNSYANGSIVGQGGWASFGSWGDRFMVQGNAVLEGTKALYCTSASDNVIVKTGTPLPSGVQVFYLKTEDRESWGYGSKVEFRLMDGPGWPPNDLCRIEFNYDGTVNFLAGREAEITFGTFNDNEWTRVTTEWRASDSRLRYRLNDESWTDWYGCFNSTFASFDRVAIEFCLYGGSGGVYVDSLGANPIPEPTTISLLIIGGILLRRRR